MSTRKIMDCRKIPSDNNCSLMIAGTEDEVIRVATWHAVDAHGEQDTPKLREQIRSSLTDEPEVTKTA